jgi:hypothetical protein
MLLSHCSRVASVLRWLPHAGGSSRRRGSGVLTRTVITDLLTGRRQVSNAWIFAESNGPERPGEASDGDLPATLRRNTIGAALAARARLDLQRTVAVLRRTAVRPADFDDAGGNARRTVRRLHADLQPVRSVQCGAVQAETGIVLDGTGRHRCTLAGKVGHARDPGLRGGSGDPHMGGDQNRRRARRRQRIDRFRAGPGNSNGSATRGPRCGSTQRCESWRGA